MRGNAEIWHMMGNPNTGVAIYEQHSLSGFDGLV